MKNIIFWNMTPCSPLSFNLRFGGTYRLHLQRRRNMFSKPANKQVASSFCLPPACALVSCSAYSSTLKMEAICSSDTSVDFQRTTCSYIPEDNTLRVTCSKWVTGSSSTRRNSYVVLFVWGCGIWGSHDGDCEGYCLVGWWRRCSVSDKCAVSIFYPEDDDGIFLRHVDTSLPIYTVTRPRRQSS
jgi:hypothetical protein